MLAPCEEGMTDRVACGKIRHVRHWVRQELAVIIVVTRIDDEQINNLQVPQSALRNIQKLGSSRPP